MNFKLLTNAARYGGYVASKVREQWDGQPPQSTSLMRNVGNYGTWIQDVAQSYGVPKPVSSVVTAVVPAASATLVGGPLGGIVLGVSQLAGAGVAEYYRYRALKAQMELYRDMQIIKAIQHTIYLFALIVIMVMFRRAFDVLFRRLNVAELIRSWRSCRVCAAHRSTKENNTDVRSPTGGTKKNMVSQPIQYKANEHVHSEPRERNHSKLGQTPEVHIVSPITYQPQPLGTTANNYPTKKHV